MHETSLPLKCPLESVISKCPHNIYSAKKPILVMFGKRMTLWLVLVRPLLILHNNLGVKLPKGHKACAKTQKKPNKINPHSKTQMCVKVPASCKTKQHGHYQIKPQLANIYKIFKRIRPISHIYLS